MNEHHGPDRDVDADGDEDPVLADAGARLRERTEPVSPAKVELAAWRRRARRVGVLAGVSLVAVAALAGALVVSATSDDGSDGADLAGNSATAPPPAQVERLLASLDDQPVDPTRVKLVSTVSTFADCDALVGDLRRVGAEHVGSRGFGGFAGRDLAGYAQTPYGPATRMSEVAFDQAVPSGAPASGTTLGTNVQVAGVDELDFVKAAGNLIYDLDGKGNLRTTDSDTLDVLSTLDVTPERSGGSGGEDGRGTTPPEGQSQASELLVAGRRVVVFGSEYEVSDPVPGDPSATRATTSYLTVTFVDASDPSKPTISDRVRVEGALVSARLVGDEVRLVTTSNMADLGFVMPTTPNSVAKALEQNRRSVASSSAADWIPDWERGGEEPEPLVPCDRVHVPDTFAGVAMTSMVTFPVGAGRFEPSGTSILAPGDTLYAGLDEVAISSQVWVDPIDRDRLEFDRWQTAIHEFSFVEGSPPTYDGSGIVDGSTIGQFSFDELGDSLAVVTTKGTPWKQDQERGVDLTVLTPDGRGALTETSKVADIAGGRGEVAAVRFVDGRVLVSTGLFGRVVQVIDVSDPSTPRKAGAVNLAGPVGYFHPLADQRALVVGSRVDEVGQGQDRRSRNWVQVQLLDVADPDAPSIVASWERPWSADNVGSDHHAFTYWPERQLAMWGVQDTRWELNREPGPHHAVVLGTAGGIQEVAVPDADKPAEVPAPCPVVPVTDPEIERMLGPGQEVLRCDDPATTEVEWPRYDCSRLAPQTVATYAPEETGDAAYFVCSPAPWPTVARVLVVSGRPMLLTDQTLEVLDPTTFATTAVAYHPTRGSYLYGYR